MKQTEISVYLFGKPEWEIKCRPTPEVLRELGKNLCKRLNRVSEIIEKLEVAGYPSQDNVYYSLDYFTDDTEEMVKEQLKGLGIGEDEVSLNIIEYEDEDIIG